MELFSRNDNPLLWAAAEFIRKNKTEHYIFSDMVKGIKCYECGFLNENYRDKEYLEYNKIECGFYYFCPKCFLRFRVPAALELANKEVIIPKQD